MHATSLSTSARPHLRYTPSLLILFFLSRKVFIVGDETFSFRVAFLLLFSFEPPPLGPLSLSPVPLPAGRKERRGPFFYDGARLIARYDMSTARSGGQIKVELGLIPVDEGSARQIMSFAATFDKRVTMDKAHHNDTYFTS